MFLLDDIKSCFADQADEENRQYMKQYMRFKFDYHGIKAPIRKKISKPFIEKARGLTKPEMIELVESLWNLPQREFQHLAMDIAIPRFKKEPDVLDIIFFEKLALKKSWWDTVDFIASKLMGNYFLKFPEKREAYSDQWIKSGKMWLMRCAILFQLKYKDQTDLKLLFQTIMQCSNTNEFFIDKAIGWILRENSKRVPDYILTFVLQNEEHLATLSKKEALRIITS